MKLRPYTYLDDRERAVTAVALPPQLLAVARLNAQGYYADYGVVTSLTGRSPRTSLDSLEKLAVQGRLVLEQYWRNEFSRELTDGSRIADRYGLVYEVLERRETISAALRRRIFERDGHACRYCGDTDRLTLDHVHPWSRGGADVEDNLVLACWACNNRKRARTLEEAGMCLRPLGSVN